MALRRRNPVSLTSSLLLSFILTSLVRTSVSQFSGRSSGLGFVGTYAEVIDKLVDALRRDGDQKDEFIIHNQLISGSSNNRENPVVDITCEDEEGVTKIILYSGQVYGYLRDHGKFGKDFDLCCQFEWNNHHIPASYEKHYIHLSRTWRGGALRNIYVGSDGLYTDEMLGGLLQNFVAVYREANGGGPGIGNGRRNWLTGWDQVGSYGVCQKKGDNDFDSEKSTLSPYLLGSSGLKCASVCRMGGGKKSNYWCYTIVTAAQTGGNWDYCSPQYQDNTQVQNNFNGRALALSGPNQVLLSSRGLRCSSDCQNYSINGNKYNYYFCTTADLYSVDGVRKYGWDYCGPRYGYDYYNRQCKSKCDFHGENYKWCWVKGGSWGYCS